MLLAKSNPERSLLHHTLDVTAMARQYAGRWRHLADLIDDETLFDDLVFAALLHDLGKAARGFQALLRGEEDDSWQRYRHEILSAALLATLPYSQRRQDLLLAVMTHHMGMNDELGARRALSDYDPRNDPLTPFGERLEQLQKHWDDLKALVTELQSHSPDSVTWFTLPEDPLKLPNPFEALEESREPKRTRRARQQEERRLPLRRIFLRGLLVGTDHLASAAVLGENAEEEKIVKPLPSLRQIRAQTFPFELNGHQEACAATTGSVFLNAPTGSGKTEAALLWTQHNQSEAQSRHVFYVLPYTASINAMYHRLKEEALFGDEAVTLLHGRSSYFAYRWLCESGSDVDPRAASKEAREARRRSKELYYPVKVLTPHQIVMAFLGVKGWEKSLCEYAGGLFILDEIHVYNPNFMGLLFETLRRLTGELGAKVCIMSATFPTLLKSVLKETVSEVRDVQLELQERARYSRHYLRVIDGSVKDYFDDIKHLLAQGLRVLVVANTVRGAMICFEALQDSATNPCLIHGRLIQRDRQRAEKRLADRSAPVDLLVGTQAIEVSLDVDFDVLYTDPAPLDALLQRFGRVNRKSLHELERLPPEARYREVVVCRSQIPDTAAIYDRSEGGKRLVKRTLETLPNEGILKEKDVVSMVDDVYDSVQLESILEASREKAGQLKQLVNNLEAGSEKPFDESVFDIDSIPIVPARFSQEHKRCVREKRFFDAQNFVFNISVGRYHGLKNKGLVQPELVERQTFLYGEFSYETGIGPDFELVDRMEAEIW